MIFIQYNPDDMLNGCRLLSGKAEIVYRRLCDLIYITDNKLFDDGETWSVLLEKFDWNKNEIKAELIKKNKIYIDNGYLRNKGCNKAIEKAKLNHESASIKGKKGADSRWNNGTANGSTISGASLTTNYKLLTTNQETINKKIKYSVSFEKFWGKGVDNIKNRSTKSDTFKQWSKLSEEDKKDLREKWDHYKDSKGDYYKACERFLAKRIFEEISLGGKVVDFDPLKRIKGYVPFVKRKQHIPTISSDMVDTMLKEGWISQEEYDNW